MLRSQSLFPDPEGTLGQGQAFGRISEQYVAPPQKEEAPGGLRVIRTQRLLPDFQGPLVQGQRCRVLKPGIMGLAQER